MGMINVNGKGSFGGKFGASHCNQLENARSSGEWIGPVQYCKLIEDRQSSADTVLTFD